MSDTGDTVAVWKVALQDKVGWDEPRCGSQIRAWNERHGNTTGKRVIRVDGKEVVRRDWMFKLVGKEQFKLGNIPCVISVDPMGSFAYEYSLEVDGRTYEKFQEEQSKKIQSWEVVINGNDVRIVLDKETMEVWANGQNIVTAGEFIEAGTETHFEITKHLCKIRSVSSGKKKIGIVHSLYVDGTLQPGTLPN